MFEPDALIEIFRDPNGPFGLSPELITNAATEGVGVLISVALSIFFAVWLDRRFDRSRRNKQIKFLLQKLINSYDELNVGLPTVVSKYTDENKISLGYTIFYIHTKRIGEDVGQLIDALLSNYGLDIDPDRVKALIEAKFNIRRIFDIADMETSISLRDAIEKGELDEEAIQLKEKYIERLENIKDRIETFGGKANQRKLGELSEPVGISSQTLKRLVSYAANKFF